MSSVSSTASWSSFVEFEIKIHGFSIMVTWDKLDADLKKDYANATVNVTFTAEHKPAGGNDVMNEFHYFPPSVPIRVDGNIRATSVIAQKLLEYSSFIKCKIK